MATFLATTGYGQETVEVSYEHDDDTNTVDFEITWNGHDVAGLISDDQRDTIEAECYANQRKLEKMERKEFEIDKGEALADAIEFDRYMELQGNMV